MKNKLAALLAALLLTASLLPAQARAASDPEDEPTITVTEPGGPDTPEDLLSPCHIPGKPLPNPEIPDKDGFSH